MPLVLSEMRPEDFPRAFEIISKAFQRRQPFMNAFYPEHDSPTGRAAGAIRLQNMDTEPNATFLKVVVDGQKSQDQPGGTMIAMAKWVIYTGEISTTPDYFSEPWWNDGQGDLDYTKAITAKFFELRNEALQKSGGRMVCLDYLATDPDCMGRGAGSMLVEWGVNEADRLDLGCVVEATDRGLPVYQKFGYKAIKHVELEMPEPWKDLPRERWTWMERRRKDSTL